MSNLWINAAFIAAALNTVPHCSAADAPESLHFSDIGGPRRVRTTSLGRDGQPRLAEIPSPGSAPLWTAMASVSAQSDSGNTATPESVWSGALGSPIRVRTLPVGAPDTAEQAIVLRGSL